MAPKTQNKTKAAKGSGGGGSGSGGGAGGAAKAKAKPSPTPAPAKSAAALAAATVAAAKTPAKDQTDSKAKAAETASSKDQKTGTAAAAATTTAAGAATAAAAAAAAAADQKSAAAAATGAPPLPTTAPGGSNPWRQHVLSAEEKAFFRENGYVVVRNAVDVASCQAVIDDMWRFLAPLSPDPKRVGACYTADPKESPLGHFGFVEMYHSQSMWDNRQNPRVYNAFADLYERDDLWVTIDRCGLKLPPSVKYPQYKPFPGFIHWDIDPADPAVLKTCADPAVPPFQLQGVLALADTDETMGGFHCCPGMHRYLPKWLAERKVDISQAARDQFYTRAYPVKVPNPERTLKGLPHTVVPMNAGDLVIWRGELAHGNGENTSAEGRIRYAQYITYYPQHFETESVRAWRVGSWKQRTHAGQVALPQLAPDGSVSKALNAAVRGDPREWEKKNAKPAVLTELGARLLGTESW